MPRIRFNGKILLVLLLMFFALGMMRFTGLERDSLSQPEIWIRDILAPLQSGVAVVKDALGGVWERFGSYDEIKEENEDLKALVAKLQQEQNSLSEEHFQNARLQRLLNLKTGLEEDFILVPARVISRGTANWYQSIVIDAGTDAGLSKDMAVMVPEGLVGRVIAVSRHSAEVLTIMDREGAVGAMLQMSRFPGVVEGTNGLVQRLQMIHLPHDAPVTTGETVVSSGLDGIFPRGIRIGYVGTVETEPNGLMKRANLTPFVDFRRLEEVFIIKEVKRGSENAGLENGSDLFDNDASPTNTGPPAAPDN